MIIVCDLCILLLLRSPLRVFIARKSKLPQFFLSIYTQKLSVGRDRAFWVANIINTYYILTCVKENLSKWSPEDLIKITTDKLAAYKNALSKQFNSRNYVDLQIVKKRFKRKLKTVKKCFVKGSEKDF